MELIVDYNTYEAKFWHNNNLLFSGFRTTEKWRYKWQLFTQESKMICEVKLKPYIISFSLNEEYHLSYLNNNNLILYYKARKGPHYTITFNNDLYQIILHKNNNLSFFKNQQQFAVLTEPSITWGITTQFHITADDDVDLDFLCTLIFATKCTEETGDSNINLKFGRIGRELKEFNKLWTPKIKL